MAEARVERVEGYAIISEDGMLANAARVMPDLLKFEADQKFFEAGLDGVDVVVHGRHSQEQQTRSRDRRRIVLTRRVPALAVHPDNRNAMLWNPAGVAFEDVLDAFGLRNPKVGVIGGAEVFQLFLDRYDVFFLSRASGVFLPGGRPIFPEVPARAAEDILAAHGLVAGPVEMLDPARDLTLVYWRRAPANVSGPRSARGPASSPP